MRKLTEIGREDFFACQRFFTKAFREFSVHPLLAKSDFLPDFASFWDQKIHMQNYGQAPLEICQNIQWSPHFLTWVQRNKIEVFSTKLEKKTLGGKAEDNNPRIQNCPLAYAGKRYSKKKFLWRHLGSGYFQTIPFQNFSPAVCLEGNS
ncbi:hypothetical protein TNCT_376311 [Trichonephila clavata]|uniref:Uncharacterized protein n=1 Tax=Trichonephila clavata TaxID=2740835 RepID=A0A8X6GLI8_TRICU|nr:hypothetical protein TNCT_376311 [Trichonephila clavata]